LGGARYRVVAATLPEGLDAIRASLAAAEISGALVELDQDRIVVHTPARRLTGRLEAAREGSSGDRALVLSDGRRFDLAIREDGDRIEVKDRGTPAGGSVTLERDPPGAPP